MDSYVISLLNANERRCRTSQRFGEQGLNFTFFDALNGEQAKAAANERNLLFNNEKLTPGEQGCFMSHVLLWEIAAASSKRYTAVFEDDITLSPTAATWLQNVGRLPVNINILKLETMQQAVQFTRKEHTFEGRMLYEMASMHWGTAGYLLSREGALSLLDYIKELPALDQPVDHVMFEYFLQDQQQLAGRAVWQLSPALCVQDCVLYGDLGADSTLEMERKIRREAESKAMPKASKVKRELLRLKRQLVSLGLKVPCFVAKPRGRIERTIKFE